MASSLENYLQNLFHNNIKDEHENKKNNLVS